MTEKKNEFHDNDKAEELITKDDLESFRNWVNRISGFFKRWGAFKLILVFFIILILFFGTDEQKQAIIDRYVLFQDWGTFGGATSYTYVIILLTVSNIATIIYFRITSKMRIEENNRLGKEKSFLQELLTNQSLHSSDSNRKTNN